jgi:hypothetical protein
LALLVLNGISGGVYQYLFIACIIVVLVNALLVCVFVFGLFYTRIFETA